ncbi:MAG: hypothetical protein ACOYN4_00895 [Bacteroidales bacterium]
MAIHIITTRIDAYHYVAVYRDICRNCQGSGLTEWETGVLRCRVCVGSGQVKVTKDITISVEPMETITNP